MKRISVGWIYNEERGVKEARGKAEHLVIEHEYKGEGYCLCVFDR